MKHAIVSSKELGTNCWITARFIDGLRCPRVMSCKYPEKKTCRAVIAELNYLRNESKRLVSYIGNKIDKLIKERG